MTAPDLETRLMERLLADAEFRTRFRRDPAAVAREVGAAELADELSGTGDPMQTLDYRESRSSVAGVMMAAAVEGIGIYELGRAFLPGIEHAQAASAGVPSSSGSNGGLDPDQYGQAGSGGQSSAETQALLENKSVTFDATGIADMKAGKMDPRVVSVLAAISEDHKITVSTTTSDHDKFTAGGSISNHYYGRAIDIATVDGQPVSPGNEAARKLAQELSSLDSSIRPSEIGSPWTLNGPEYFTDGAHQDHLHVGFDDPIDASWQPPAGAVSSPAGSDLAAVPDSAVNQDDAGDADAEDSDGTSDEEDSEEEDEDEPDEDSAEHDAWDETHESGSDEDSSGSGDDGSSESGSDEDDGSDGNSESGSDEDSGSDSGADAAPGAAPAPDDGVLQVPDGSGEYPGDDAASAETAAWMASEAQKRGLPSELPVMAALVESGMKNLPGGDADSVGFFQMRVGIWNQGEYSGYPDKPKLQLQWFLDHAAAVKKQRVAGGQPVDDPKHYGEWIADIERPAAQYRGRYQLRLDEAQALLKQAGGKQSAGNGADLVDRGGGTKAGRRAVAALAEAKKYTGTPYLWGGSTPKTGFDCSGLVQWAYAKAGIRIPRVTDQQILAANGTSVSRKHLLPGDLVFFHEPGGNYVGHVGISLGGNKFLHAPHTGDVVKTSSLKESYYAQQFAGARRFDKPVSGAGAQAAGDQVQVASAGQRPPSAEEQAVRLARAALDRDAREVQRSNSALFKALERQERNNSPNEVQFLRAVEPVP